MSDWLRVYMAADVVPFIEAFRRMAEHYYPDTIDVCKDAVSIPGISMKYSRYINDIRAKQVLGKKQKA